MGNHYDQMIDEYLSLSCCMICWDRITSISIFQPFMSSHLRVLFSQTTNIRTLTLTYSSEWCRRDFSNDKSLNNLMNDESLCNILTSNGLRQLNLITCSGHFNLINLSHLIVERLPYLEVIEINGDIQQIEMTSIFINGLSKLSFVTLSGFDEIYFVYEKEIILCNSNTRSFRMEMSTGGFHGSKLLIWL